MERPRPSHIAWGALLAGVAAYEVACPQRETFSEGLDSPLERPLSRIAIIGAVTITAAHLINVFDTLGIKEYDPFHYLTKIKL